MLTLLVNKAFAITKPCYYYTSAGVYTCQLRNVSYTDESGGFKIEGNNHSQSYDDSKVVRVWTLSSVINFMPMEIFQKFKNLKSLEMENVKLKVLNWPLENCESLESLMLSGNKLESIDNVFDGCTSLKVLNLYSNEIETIDGDAFKNLLT